MEEARPPGEPGLRFTGQAIIDVGVATIVAYSGRRSPSQVTPDDLDRMGEYISEVYTKPPLKSFLTSIYPNSAYVNPTMGEEKRKATMFRYLRGYREKATANGRPCAFCGRPSVDSVYRQHVPLSSGEDVINFGPNGQPGLPVCGGCLIASQAFPLGCAMKCEGRALLVHSDNPELTQAFVALFLAENRRLLTLTDAGDDRIGYPRTIVVSRLLQIEEERPEDYEVAGSITAYHLTNYGQNPDLTIYHLPSGTVSFLRTVRGEKHRRPWQAVVAQGWVEPKRAKKAQGTKGGSTAQPTVADPGSVGPRRNSVFEDLFVAQAQPARFIRRYLLRGAAAPQPGDDTPVERVSRISWPLTEVFLRKVLEMETHRVEAIRRCGERLAAAIEANNDGRLLREIYIAKPYSRLRNVLIKASSAQLRADAPPIVTFDDFVTIFEDGEDLPRVDWSLARDLIYIRVLDALYSAGWFKKNDVAAKEVLQEIEAAAEPQEEGATISA